MRLFVLRRREDTNDVVGYIISCFCVFYGLLLGLIAVAAYQNYADVESSVSNEAAALAALYEDVSVYEDPYGQNLRWLLRDFCRFTIRYGWPEYQQGRIPPGSDVRLRAFHEQLLAFEPQTTSQEIVHAESLRQFNVFMEKHRISTTSRDDRDSADHVVRRAHRSGAEHHACLAFRYRFSQPSCTWWCAGVLPQYGHSAHRLDGQSFPRRSQHPARGVRDLVLGENARLTVRTKDHCQYSVVPLRV